MAIALCGVMTSCNKDNVGAKYTPNFQNISFEAEEASPITTAETMLTVPVRVTRSIAKGEYTANFTLKSENTGVFSTSDNGAVTFADGQGVAYINLVASNLVKGEDYSCTITLDEKEVATADTITKTQIVETVVSIHADYNWLEYGTGFYSSPDWWEEEYDVDIMKAEGANLYKIKDLFAKGYDIQFEINGSNQVVVPRQASWKHSSYGTVYLQGMANEDNSNVAGTYDAATKKATFILEHTVSAGSFGVYTDVLTMP